MIKKIFSFFIFVFIFNFSFAKLIFDFTWKVVNVVDWDTIWVETRNRDIKIRLLWIDAPEILHSWTRIKYYKFYWCWNKAKKFSEKLLLWKVVKIYKDSLAKNKDKYWRYLRYVFVNLNINWKTINIPYWAIALYKGMARVYKYENFTLKKIYFKLENIAKKRNYGIRSEYCKKEDEFIKNNFKFRSIPSTSISIMNDHNLNNCGYTYHKIWCDIKWNINRRWEKIYHLPGRKYYNRTIITPSKWERWFCSEIQAINCWWRPSKIKY